jgi:hypothetical protein
MSYLMETERAAREADLLPPPLSQGQRRAEMYVVPLNT